MNYNILARRRIWSALLQIRESNPGLIWKDIAAQISTQNDITFDRRYFLRINDGTLRDAIVHHVVIWISNNFIPDFDKTVNEKFPTPPIEDEEKSTIFGNGLHWQNLNKRMSDDILERLELSGQDKGLSQDDYYILSTEVPFSEKYKLLAIKHRANNKPIFQIFMSTNHEFLITSNIDDYNDQIQHCDFSINRQNLFAYLDISARKLGPVCAYLPIYNLMHLRSNYDRSKYTFPGNVIQYDEILLSPSVVIIEGDYDVHFSAFDGPDIRNIKINIREDGHIAFVSDRIILSSFMTELPPNEKSSEDFGKKASIKIRPHGHQNSIKNHLLETLSKSKTGRLLRKIHDDFKIDIAFMPSPDFSTYFDDDICKICVLVPDHQEALSVDQILDVIVQFRYADLHLSRWQFPDPRGNITKYAGVMHAARLLGLVVMSKFISDLNVKDRVKFENALNPTMRLLHKKREAGASEKILYSIYAGTYREKEG